MRAVILAGGRGTRLKPYTTLIPKPLVPLGAKYSILEIVILQLSRQGFTHITLAVNHLANLIMAYFGDGSKWNVKLNYSLEEKPLSTIGPLTLIEDLPEQFLVMNGDILCDLNYGEFCAQHADQNHDISVAAYRRETKIDFGVLELEGDRLTGFKEKPCYHFDVSMGIYCLSRRVVEALPRNEPYGFDQLMRDGIDQQKDIRIKRFDGFWLDVGRPEDYDAAEENSDVILEKLGVNS